MSDRARSDAEKHAVTTLQHLYDVEQSEDLVDRIRMEGIAEGFKISRERMQESMDDGLREYAENIWNECADAAGDMASDLKALNPHTVEASMQDELRRSEES